MNTRQGSHAAQLLIATLVAMVMSWGTTAMAAEAVPTAQDPVAASRAVRLSEQLRCLVCQNQTIAESNADLALDLRQQIREQIAAGKSDDEITEYMVNRYGDFVLYRPPFKTTTLLLWLGPAVLLILAMLVLARVLRARRAADEQPPLSPEDRERAARLLAGESPKETT
jgi:cytochrome c-type biogenesis protein CcmH